MSPTNIDDPVIQLNSIVGTEKKYNLYEIIYGNLRPWLSHTCLREEHYINLLRNFVCTPKIYPTHFRMDGCVPIFTAKVKYYLSLIDNDAIALVNRLMEEEKIDKNLVAYQLDQTIKGIIDLLMEIYALIELRKYNNKAVFATDNNVGADCNHRECAYIFHYLFSACICCLLEIQANFKEFISRNNLLTVADIYNIILKKPLPEQPFIHKIDTRVSEVAQISPSGQTNEDETFVRQYAHEKYSTFMEEVEFYRFDQLPKIRSLSTVSKNRLIQKIVENPLSYSVAMLSFLGYLNHLSKSYALSKVDIYKHLAKAFNIDVRTVKGNCLVLSPNSKEDRYKYQADQYLCKVKEEYQAILADNMLNSNSPTSS